MIRSYQSALEYARRRAEQEAALESQRQSSVIPIARVLKDGTIKFIRVKRKSD